MTIAPAVYATLLANELTQVELPIPSQDEVEKREIGASCVHVSDAGGERVNLARL